MCLPSYLRADARRAHWSEEGFGVEWFACALIETLRRVAEMDRKVVPASRTRVPVRGSRGRRMAIITYQEPTGSPSLALTARFGAEGKTNLIAPNSGRNFRSSLSHRPAHGCWLCIRVYVCVRACECAVCVRACILERACMHGHAPACAKASLCAHARACARMRVLVCARGCMSACDCVRVSVCAHVSARPRTDTTGGTYQTGCRREIQSRGAKCMSPCALNTSKYQ